MFAMAAQSPLRVRWAAVQLLLMILLGKALPSGTARISNVRALYVSSHAFQVVPTGGFGSTGNENMLMFTYAS